MRKRDFLKTFACAPAITLSAPSARARDATDEQFWAGIRTDYRLPQDYTNLENGYYSPQPETVLNQFIKNVKLVNTASSRYMREAMVLEKQRTRECLASLAGCASDELIITRNTTESLDTVISGIDWKEDDEAVMARQDYGSMLDMFKQQASRHGIKLKIVDVPLYPNSDEEIVDLYASMITSKTRLIMVSHMINITGQILPVRAICDMAHSRGIEVMVDGAHTFAHLNFTIPELNCDYYGASLHKWLCAPLGAGILYAKKEHVSRLWPLFGDYTYPNTRIDKLNHTGTHPAHTDKTIHAAISYHNMVGRERKEARLRHLQQYWTKQVAGLPNIEVLTPREPHRSCAIATVGLKNLSPARLAEALFQKYKIFTVAIDGAGVQGVRVTPQIFTSLAELDHLVRALKELSQEG